MLRRLFYLFPDEDHARRVVEDLDAKNIEINKIHAISKVNNLKYLPPATERQQRDTGFALERALWTANLLLFAVALVVFLWMLAIGEIMWSLLAIALMLACLVAGEHFVVHVPNVHLTEFTDALAHGEVLLMIDVPGYRVAEVDDFVRHRHPEAVTGGVGWSAGCLGI